MRAFIFSLDAFIAFTLALVAIYSLIFFSSIPTSYYYLLTQGHYLTKDVLLSLSTAKCSDGLVGLYTYAECPASYSGTLLDRIASGTPSDRQTITTIKYTIGRLIPPQFGYKVEVSSDGGSSWGIPLYDTSNPPSIDSTTESHANSKKKLSISAQVFSFGYSDIYSRSSRSRFSYLSCSGEGATGGTSVSGSSSLITCGPSLNSPPLASSRGGSGTFYDLVPIPNMKVVRLTVFI